PGVRIGDIVVKSEDSAKFLGTAMDKALRWKEQHSVMVKKGQGWLVQFRRLARMKDSMAGKHIRQLYKAKAIPRMLYAADVTLTPQQKRRKGQMAKKTQVLQRLTSIQRQAAILISGAMLTTATDILNIHAALLPLDLEVE
ncbi:hypothetical protein BT96DRAFT_763620, partial [Gymnopus androsaceus JB14]